jgi:hypothetical protein
LLQGTNASQYDTLHSAPKSSNSGLTIASRKRPLNVSLTNLFGNYWENAAAPQSPPPAYPESPSQKKAKHIETDIGP